MPKPDSSTKPLELFVDRSLGRRVVPAALRAVYAHVLSHDEVFPQDSDDETWLRAAGRRGWVVLTKDDRIRYRPGEQRAILEARARCFCLHPTKGMTGAEMARALVAALPRILTVAGEESPPFIKGVNRRGQIRHLFP